MRDETIARNYADALLSLATKANDLEGWGRMINDVASLVTRDVTVRRFLESPRTPAAAKIDVLRKALQDRMPRLFVRFLEALVQNRRQMLIPEIAHEYATMVDAKLGRVHAEVTLARAPEAGEVEAIAASLSRTLGKQAVPQVRVNPEIIGGVIVKVGDYVKDGSVRRKLGLLRAKLTTR
jgi:F-type H+-transporting ATPase subunit delta